MYDNLDILIRDPVWITGNYEKNITQYNSYSHTISAVGGFWNASLSIPVTKPDAEEWFANGIGRDITIYNTRLKPVFNGFVNKININISSLSIERGPLVDIANDVSLVFSTVDTSTTPPILGVREQTASSSDTISQARYGVIEKILSSGGTEPTTADQIRDTFLEENKDPQTSQSIAIGGQNQSSTMTLEILGYVHWFSLYAYNETTTGTRTYTLRLQDVIGADPNSIISTNYANIATNAATVPRYDNDSRKAWAVIKDIISKGDSSYNRYTFGIYEDRQATYATMPVAIDYYYQLSDNKQRILAPPGNDIKIYDVRPARWIQVSDWMVGRSPEPADVRKDQRNIFIEQVTFTSPDSLQIKGGKVSSMPQLLGKLGLSGIGA